MADLIINSANVIASERASIDRGIAGEEVRAGQPLIFASATRRMRLAENDATSEEARRVIAIALNHAFAGQPVAFLTSGEISLGPILTPGRAYYLSNTPGGICLLSDLNVGNYICLIGLAVSDSRLSFCPQYPDVVSTAPIPPTGFVFLVDSDGAYFADVDGALLVEAI